MFVLGDGGTGRACPCPALSVDISVTRQAGARRSQETARAWKRLAPAGRIAASRRRIRFWPIQRFCDPVPIPCVSISPNSGKEPSQKRTSNRLCPLNASAPNARDSNT